MAFYGRAVICEQLTAGCAYIQPLHVANLRTWQGQFCPFLKKIKISICVFSKASFPHLSTAVGLEILVGSKILAPSIRWWLLLPKGDCAFWHLVGVRFGASLEVSFRLGCRIVVAM